MHNQLIKTTAILLATLLPSVFIGLQIDGRAHFPTELTFIAILLQSSTLAFGFGAPLFKAYFSFSYFFFGLAPYLEFKKNIVYWGGAQIDNSTYLLTNNLILLLNSSFLIIYLISKHLKSTSPATITQNKKQLTLKNHRGIITTTLVIFSSLGILLHINNYSILSLIFRGGEHKDLIELAGPTQTLIQSFFRFLPMVMFTAYLNFSHRPLLPTLTLAVGAIIAASPLGMPRFMVAALYIPLLFTFFPSLIKGNYLPALLFLGLAFAFPLLNQFRNYTTNESITFIQTFDFMLEGHFDSYQSLARIVQENTITWGNQLLGVIFFFIPRTLWESKPIGTGAEIAKQEGYDFSNISANFYTEGFINFGLAGCLIFCILLAYWCSKLDRRWDYEKNQPTYYRMMYYSTVGYIFFILRGDLLSSTANGVSLILAHIITMKIILWSSK